MSDLGWINTYLGIVVPGASVAYGTFLLRHYYKTLPIEILNAAHRYLLVDGGGGYNQLGCGMDTL